MLSQFWKSFFFSLIFRNILLRLFLSLIKSKELVLQLLMVTLKRIITFVLTNLAYQSMIGQFGVNSIVKKPIGTLFGYDETFLGIIDGTEIAGQLAGYIITLFIQVTPQKGFLIYGSLNMLFGLFLFLPRYIPNILIRDTVLLFSFFCQTIFTSSMAFSQIIYSSKKTSQTTQSQQSVWYSMVFLGDIISVIYAQSFILELNFRWQFVKLIWNFYILFLGAIIFYYFRNQSLQDTKFQGQMAIPEEEKLGLNNLQILVLLGKKMYGYLCQKKVFLIVISFGLIQGLNGSEMFWLPYYYTQMGEQAFSILTPTIISISILLGCLISQLIIYGYFQLEEQSKRISLLLLLISCITYFILWLKRYDQPKVQTILFSVGSIAISSPYCRVSMAQVVQQSKNDTKKAKTIFLMSHISRSIVIILFVIICGYLMNKNKYNMWHVILGTIFIILCVGVVRAIVYQKENQNYEIEYSKVSEN